MKSNPISSLTGENYFPSVKYVHEFVLKYILLNYAMEAILFYWVWWYPYQFVILRRGSTVPFLSEFKLSCLQHQGINIEKLCNGRHIILCNLIKCNPILCLNRRKLNSKLISEFVLKLSCSQNIRVRSVKSCNGCPFCFTRIWWNAISSYCLNRRRLYFKFLVNPWICYRVIEFTTYIYMNIVKLCNGCHYILQNFGEMKCHSSCLNERKIL